MAVLAITQIKRWTGKAADSKPTSAPSGSLYEEVDTGIWYIWNGSAWSECPAGGV